jgi:hypothetical protein
MLTAKLTLNRLPIWPTIETSVSVRENVTNQLYLEKLTLNRSPIWPTIEDIGACA